MATDLNALREAPTVLEETAAAISVSVVICCYTMARLELTTRCAREVLNNTREPEEVIVVVDNNPELRECLRARLPAGVVLLDSDGRGVSDGRTTGLRYAHGEVVAFIDDDAWPDPDWLERLLPAFLDANLIGVGGLVTPDWEVAERALPPELYWVVGSTYTGHRTDAGPITRPIGANMAARRVALLELGGFSADFGRYENAGSNEELAMFSAVTAHFGPDRIWYVPEAVVHHFAPEKRCRFSYLMRRSVMEGISKADARTRYGSHTMAHDHDYVRRIIFPSTLGYSAAALRRGDPDRLRFACQIISCFLVTALAYGLRRGAATARGALGHRRAASRGAR